MVGTSGSIADRVLPVTASGRNCPDLICAAADATALNMIWVWPAITEAIAGPAPPNGTCATSSASDMRNCSPVRCVVVPAPGEAILYLPGLALMSATNSLTVFAGTEGLTESTVAELTASVTAAKSLTG